MPVEFAIIPGSITQVSFRGELFGQLCLNTFHYKYTGTTSIVDGPAAFNSIVAAMEAPGGLYNTYTDVLAEGYTVRGIDLQYIFPVRYVKLTFAPTVDEGGATGPPLPPGTAVAITKKANVANKHGRGTLHMPAVPPSFVDNGFVSTVGGNLYRIFASRVDDVISIAAGQTFTPVIWNRAQPNQSETVVDCVVQSTVRTQRTRVIGKGV